LNKLVVITGSIKRVIPSPRVTAPRPRIGSTGLIECNTPTKPNAPPTGGAYHTSVSGSCHRLSTRKYTIKL